LDLTNSGIHVAEYWTQLPSQDVFERKLQEIVIRAEETLAKLENKKE